MMTHAVLLFLKLKPHLHQQYRVVRCRSDTIPRGCWSTLLLHRYMRSNNWAIILNSKKVKEVGHKIYLISQSDIKQNVSHGLMVKW
jgi:hypothetical protein